MKKRIITLLAILALLVVCAVFAVQADPTYIDLTTFNCPCSSCNGQPYTGTWITWDDVVNGGTSIVAPADGAHYYINANITPGAQISTGAKEVVVVLDNCTYTCTGTGRAILVGSAGGKLHLIGNNATFTTNSTTTSNGAIAQLSNATAGLHLYGDLTIEKSELATGASTNSGLFRLYQGTVHIHDCDGMGLPTTKDPVLNAPALANTTASLGGISNLESAKATFIMDAGTLNGTTTCYRGGVLSNAGGTITINGGTINGGIAGNRGGIIMNSSGTLNIGGTAVLNAEEDMTASYRGVVLAGGTFNFSGGTINSCNVGLGDGIAITKGTLNLSGNATVQNAAGTKTNNIWRWNDTSNTNVIQVDSEWSGTASISLPGFDLENHGSAFASSVLYFGTLSDGTFTNGTSTTAVRTGMYLENADHEYPRMAGYTRNLVACRAGLYEDGALTDWYVTPGNAIGAYAASEATSKYIKLWADYATTANTEVYFDLNGRDITKLTKGEEGKIYVFDSTIADQATAGATVTADVEPITVAPNGKIYAVVAGDSANTVYEIGVTAKVDRITFRPSVAGMYYGATATFTGTDEAKAVAEANLSTGVAVSIYEIEDLSNSAWTATPGSDGNGVLVSGILKDSAEKDNATDADRVVYAEACVTYGDQLVYLSDDNTGYSLTGLMEKVAAQKPDNTDAQAFYAKWAKGEGLTVGAPVTAWTQNETINVLDTAE